ncbi:hypothetical protein MATL_G00226970 [Megalops atlanticus]|uniref:Uncharacterized protein n=1 Tax=Megalops atlanticus TaxID=7932 RepID=A0A9D3PK38_MEGAT|nr:hypothetical protein MATL_G00226970 [Megalops atlanticus]
MDDHNVALFPDQDGKFDAYTLTPGSHYEVHGDTCGTQTDGPAPALPASSTATQGSRFSFARPSCSNSSAPATSATKIFQRSLYIADLVDGRPVACQTLVIQFTEMDATVPGILMKVKEALGQDEPLTLTDSQGNEILDTSGTTAREMISKRACKRFLKGLMKWCHQHKALGVAVSLRNLSELSNAAVFLTIAPQQAEEIKAIFCCLMCKGPMNDPVFTTCCSSLVGCRICGARVVPDLSNVPKMLIHKLCHAQS